MSHINTIGLFGAIGNLGAPTVKYLLQAHQARKLKLVIIARPTAKIGKEVEDGGVEVRRIDADHGSDIDVAKAVEGIEYFISTVGPPGFAAESRLFDALIPSPAFVTATPAVYGRNWTPEDLEAIPELRDTEDYYWYAARKLERGGKGLTDVWAGAFAREFLIEGTLDYLGFGLAWLASKPLSDSTNKQFAFISHRVSGRALQSALRAVNGAEPAVTPMGPREIKWRREEGPLKPFEGAMIIPWMEGRESGSYKNEVTAEEMGYKGIKTLEEEVRAAKEVLQRQTS